MAWGCSVCELLSFGNGTIVFRCLAGCFVFTILSVWARANVRICPVCDGYLETYTYGKDKTYCNC